MEKILVFVIIISSLIYLSRRWWQKKEKGCSRGCGCRYEILPNFTKKDR